MVILFGVDVLCGTSCWVFPAAQIFKSSAFQRQWSMLPALPVIRKKKSATGPQTDSRLWQHVHCQAFIPFWKRVAMPPKHFQFYMWCNQACVLEKMREMKVGEGHFTQWKDVCWVRGNTCSFFPFFFFFLQKGSTHRRLAVDLLYTQWWLNTKQWETEIGMFLQRLVLLHPSHRLHLGQRVLPGLTFPPAVHPEWLPLMNQDKILAMCWKFKSVNIWRKCALVCLSTSNKYVLALSQQLSLYVATTFSTKL